MSNPTRRDCLRLASAFAAARALPAANKGGAARSRVIGANDRINVAFIGVGGKGTSHVRALIEHAAAHKDIALTGVSDVYTRHAERARGLMKLDARQVHPDYRDLLARPDVDAVYIATPDHWHARMALDAMNAGKDVYLEKPMTYTIGEARLLHETATRLERVLQVGSQHLSDARWSKAKELIASGAIGELLWAQTTYSRYSTNGEWNYFVEPEGTPETIDWPRWLGSAPKRPFSAERYFRWRKYWDYSGGIATDLFYHRLGPVLYAMGAQFPTRVSASGGIYVQKDREVPDTYATTVEYPNFYITMSSSMANSSANTHFAETIYGHGGTLTFAGGNVVITPEGRNAKPVTHPVEHGDMAAAHRSNFFDCMRTRKKPALHSELGFQIMTAIRLGVDSYRQGRMLTYDPKTHKVTDKFAPRPGYEGKGENFEGSRRRGA